MKKILVLILSICFLLPVYSQDKDFYHGIVPQIINYNGDNDITSLYWYSSLQSTARQKYQGDTLYVDLCRFSENVSADSILIEIGLNSSNTIFPSTGLKYNPILFLEKETFLTGNTLLVSDTLVVASNLLADSLVASSNAIRYTIPKLNSQYKLSIYTTFDDTTNIEATTKVDYFIRISLKGDD